MAIRPLRIVHCCAFCGRERNPEDLADNKDFPGKRFCRTDLVACLNRGWRPKHQRGAA